MEETQPNNTTQKWETIYSPPEVRLSTAKKKELFVEKYKINLFSISKTCKDVDITRWTFYNWLNNDESFKKKITEKNEELKDLVELKIKELALKGNTRLLEFYAKCLMKDRGYFEKHEIVGNVDASVEEAKRLARVVEEVENNDKNTSV